MSTGVPTSYGSQIPGGVAISINREDGQIVQDTSTGEFRRWNALTENFEVINIGSGSGSGGSGVTEQSGLPNAAPTDRNAPATIFSTNSNTTWQWDVADQMWRSVGTISDQATGDIQPNVWVNFPTFSLITTVESWSVFDASGQRLDYLEDRRRSSDGWPQVRSLNAYTAASFEAKGHGAISVP